jgi:hypothetical protein
MYLWPQKFNVYKIGGVVLTAVLQIRVRIRIRIHRIWIHRIHVFLGILDPDPDQLVRGMDPDPVPDLDPSNIKQK